MNGSWVGGIAASRLLGLFNARPFGCLNEGIHDWLGCLSLARALLGLPWVYRCRLGNIGTTTWTGGVGPSVARLKPRSASIGLV